MPSQAKPIPNGFHSLTPYLCVNDAARAIEFYGKVFDATLMMRLADAGGRVGHAELQVGDSVIMLADEHPEYGVRSPQSFGDLRVILKPFGSWQWGGVGQRQEASCSAFYPHSACVSYRPRPRNPPSFDHILNLFLGVVDVHTQTKLLYSCCAEKI